ncbi:MAG TPA: hypothetical protein PLW97_09870 [Synergistaceae bacterium]|nr:hypothetical protein [Synergistaceae bacterium]HPQ37937.1 hypothetical protein [Synergistaceae bacterium]
MKADFLWQRLGKVPLLRKLFRKTGTPEKSAEETPEEIRDSEVSEESLLFDDLSPERSGEIEEKEDLPEDEKPYREEKKKFFSPKGILRILFLIALLLFGVASWKFARNLFRDPLGPDLRNLSKKEESLYCPLGFPLRGWPLSQEFKALGVVFSRDAEGLFQGNSDKLEILVSSSDAGIIPLYLAVKDKRIPVKWGLGVSASKEKLLEILGKPWKRSGDAFVYGDTWGNLLIYEISGDMVYRVELRYPGGLILEE